MDAKKPMKETGQRPKLRAPRRGGARPATPAPATSTASPAAPRNAAKTIAININFSALPRVKLPSRATLAQARRRIATKKAIAIASIVAIALSGTLVAGASIHQRNLVNNANTTGNPNKIIENLEYQTVLPTGESISALGGWKRVSPPDSDPVYAYIDAIDSIAISVSQQPLPKTFEEDTDTKVADLAKKFNATTKLDAGSTKVYVGTSAKGPQSVILTKNGLLILIKSQSKISDTSWVKYAKSLN